MATQNVWDTSRDSLLEFQNEERGGHWCWLGLTGLFFEAAQTKGLVPVALKIAEAFLDPRNRVESWMINLLKQSLLIDTILQSEGEAFRLKGQGARDFEQAILNYNLLSTELRMHFAGKQWFNYTIKQHALAHIAIDAKEISPRQHAGESPG